MPFVVLAVDAAVLSVMRRRDLLVGLAAAGIVACTRERDAPANASAAPPLLATPARDVWPLPYREAPAAMREAYAFAIAHPRVRKYVPCFCGCGAIGHRDNYECFVKAEPTPGSFLLDAHGFACGSCVAVALEAKAMLADGLSVKAIRRAIDDRWAGVGSPTRNPLPD